MKAKEGIRVTFVTADSCRARLEQLTQILVFSFPGSTIYQHTDLLRVPHDVLNHKVDAVLLEAEMEKMNTLELVQKLRREKPTLPVFIISKSYDHYAAAAAAGANGYFVLPGSEQNLLAAIRLVETKRNPHKCEGS